MLNPRDDELTQGHTAITGGKPGLELQSPAVGAPHALEEAAGSECASYLPT